MIDSVVHMKTTLAWSLAACLTVGVAQAEPGPERSGEAWAERPFSIELMMGVATPLGLGGFMVEVAPVRWLSLGCGIGTNIIGPEVACMSRFRVASTPDTALALGLGVSGGPHHQSPGTALGALSVIAGPLSANGESPWPSSYHWARALWLNGEVGYERRWPTGLGVRAFVGLARILNPDDRVARPAGPDPGQHRSFQPNTTLPYAGLGWGYAF